MSHRHASTFEPCVHIYRNRDTPSVMVLGGKTLLWCENGIVFLRPPQTFADVSLTPEGTGSLFRLQSRASSVLSERDHLFTGRCDLVIPPLSRDLFHLLFNSERERRAEEGE